MANPRYRQHHAAAATRITPENWAAVRTAIKDVGDRFAAMILEAPADAMATADWTIMDTAAHVASLALIDTALVVSDDHPVPVPGADAVMKTTNVYNINDGLNTTLFHNYPERRPREVAACLSDSIGQMLELTADADPERTVGWLGESRLPLAGLFAHLVNEVLLHGRDVAAAARVPWSIPQEYIAMVIELFMFEIARNGVGTVLDGGKPIPPERIAVEFRSAYTRPITIAVHDGEVLAEEPSRDNDVRLYFQPLALDLVLFHRISRKRAVATGALRVWGRRPWLLFPFLEKIRMP